MNIRERSMLRTLVLQVSRMSRIPVMQLLTEYPKIHKRSRKSFG